MDVHNLKTIDLYFEHVHNGSKTFELRQYTAQGDQPARDFKVGDIIMLSCDGNQIDRLERVITYVLKDTDYCMEGRMAPGYCILGIKPVGGENIQPHTWMMPRAISDWSIHSE